MARGGIARESCLEYFREVYVEGAGDPLALEDPRRYKNLEDRAIKEDRKRKKAMKGRFDSLVGGLFEHTLKTNFVQSAISNSFSYAPYVSISQSPSHIATQSIWL